MKHDEYNKNEKYSNSSNGKTSMGKVMGERTIMVGLICFMYSVFFLSKSVYLVQVLTACSSLVLFGSSMILGKILKPTQFEDNSKKEEV